MRIFGSLKRRLRQAQSPTSIETIRDAGAAARGNVIFVHGLDGDPISSWELRQERENWGTWLLAAEPDLNVYSIGYRITSKKSAGGAMPMPQRAINILSLLQTRLNTKVPTILICHSYGGLLVKHMLRSAIDVATEYKSLADSIRGVVFFGTPHSGASLADYLAAIRVFVRSTSAIEELRDSSASLLDLNQWFRNRIRDLDLQVMVFFETMKTFQVSVVSAASADPGISGVTPIPIDSDHIDLPKPRNADDTRVARTIAFISALVRAPQPGPAPPFRIDLRKTLKSIKPAKRSGNFYVSLPFITYAADSTEQEVEIAKEVVIRLKDRRVLSAWECCDRCIDESLESIQKVRQILTDKKVDIASFESPLYILFDIMNQGIKQFLTFQEGLGAIDKFSSGPSPFSHYRDEKLRDEYFASLEVLRKHLNRCLIEVAYIAGIELQEPVLVNYLGPWDDSIYVHVDDLSPETVPKSKIVKKWESGVKEANTNRH